MILSADDMRPRVSMSSINDPALSIYKFNWRWNKERAESDISSSESASESDWEDTPALEVGEKEMPQQ